MQGFAQLQGQPSSNQLPWRLLMASSLWCATVDGSHCSHYGLEMIGKYWTWSSNLVLYINSCVFGWALASFQARQDLDEAKTCKHLFIVVVCVPKTCSEFSCFRMFSLISLDWSLSLKCCDLYNLTCPIDVGGCGCGGCLRPQMVWCKNSSGPRRASRQCRPRLADVKNVAIRPTRS